MLVLNGRMNGRGEETTRLVERLVDLLLCRYGEEALLKAALCAHDAIERGRVEDCLIWRDVMDTLDMKRSSSVSGSGLQ